jgi:hypothetical protein
MKWDAAASNGGWKTARRARLSPVKGVGVGRAAVWRRLRAPSDATAQGRRVWGEKGDVAIVNQREKRRMEELTRYGPSTAMRTERQGATVAERRSSRGHRQGF